jgi:hypothetical protein
MTAEVLTTEQINNFIDRGFCTLSGAFTAGQAAAARRRLWRRMEQKAGIRGSDPSTWPPNYDIEEHLDGPEVTACFTDRLAAAIEQLVGPGRWSGIRRWGFWPVNFSFGADRPYDYPSTSWHIDGNWFRHTINSPHQGLLVIGLFTDIEQRWGGTILALGSHKRTARVLARHPGGIHHRELFREVLRQPIGNFHEITGAAGDVVLAHPFPQGGAAKNPKNDRYGRRKLFFDQKVMNTLPGSSKEACRERKRGSEGRSRERIAHPLPASWPLFDALSPAGRNSGDLRRQPSGSARYANP